MTGTGAVRCGTRRKQENQVPAEQFLYYDYGELFCIRGAIVRVRIDIDDRLLSAAMRAGGCETKSAAVEAGLRLLARKKGYRAIIALRGTIHWDGDSSALRREMHRASLKAAKPG